MPGIASRHDNVDIVIIRENMEGEFSGMEHEVSGRVNEGYCAARRGCLLPSDAIARPVRNDESIGQSAPMQFAHIDYRDRCGVTMFFVPTHLPPLDAAVLAQVVPGVTESLKVMTRDATRRIAQYAFEYAFLNNRAKVSEAGNSNKMFTPAVYVCMASLFTQTLLSQFHSLTIRYSTYTLPSR